jgi:hypothetical protein
MSAAYAAMIAERWRAPFCQSALISFEATLLCQILLSPLRRCRASARRQSAIAFAPRFERRFTAAATLSMPPSFQHRAALQLPFLDAEPLPMSAAYAIDFSAAILTGRAGYACRLPDGVSPPPAMPPSAAA